MRRPIGQVKKEIRTLGLDTCNPRSVVGVIVRGGLYLDGVVSFPHAQNEPARNCAERIIELRYFPELRAMMLHDPKDQLEDRKSTRLNSSHSQISYAVFCLKKKIDTVVVQY